MGFPSLLVFFFVFHLFLLTYCGPDCPKSFPCKDIGPLEYPLTESHRRECGLIEVDCDIPSSTPIISVYGEQWTDRYDILKVNIPSHELMVRDNILKVYLQKRSCHPFGNISLLVSPMISFTFSQNLTTLFTCNKPFTLYFENYKNYSVCENFMVYYRNPWDGNLDDQYTDLPSECSSFQLPINGTENSSEVDLFKLLTSEYSIEWHLTEPTKGKSRKKVIIVAGASVATLIAAASSIIFVLFRKNLRKSLAFQKAYAKKQVDIELFLKNHGSTLAPKMYKYSHLKKITNSFSENLGEGGYGSVYKGKLQDGSLVAVKILSESKGNGEEFINEVSSISRTSHVNIVALLGFCFDSSKRALIYEFMPNGSLEKFIPNTSSSAQNSSLGVEKLFEIVVGIARGLEYLHQGCNTRILHFDIKPHNILLDKDWNPKISDFGLSKLCPNRSSIVSMQVARGTVGYIAPEVFCRNFGEVSHKSDVYSYGMMVLDMAVGRQHNIDPQGQRSSEIYFSDWIYKNLEQNTIGKGILDSDISQEDERNFVKRRLIIIGLWCIQTDPKKRPSISGVIEMLEAKLESLQLPPRPYLSSSSISPPMFPGSDSEPLP